MGEFVSPVCFTTAKVPKPQSKIRRSVTQSNQGRKMFVALKKNFCTETKPIKNKQYGSAVYQLSSEIKITRRKMCNWRRHQNVRQIKQMYAILLEKRIIKIS